MEYEIEEGQIVLCTVEKIIGTTVFVKIQNNGEGTITTSEISPGRIRNLRDYVVPGKEIVCKILRIDNRGVHLSLRRVKQNEKKELLDRISKEKSNKAILKTVFGKEKAENIINKITESYSILDFFEQIKQNPKLLEKYANKEQTEKIIKILESKKEKLKEIRQNFNLSSKANNGIKIIKKIIETASKNMKCKITYLAAGKFRVLIKGEDFKKLKTKLNNLLKNIEVQAKKQNCNFSIIKN